MDHITFKLKVTSDDNFIHWNDLQEHIKNIIVSVGLHPAWFQLSMIDLQELEHKSFNNVLSATYNLKEKILYKTCRIDDCTLAQNMYDKFLHENSKMILDAKKLGLEFLPLEIERNVIPNIELINKTLSALTSTSIPSCDFSLLENLLPLQVVDTDYGKLFVKKDYVEVWFDKGHTDYICNFDVELKKFYYAMYKENIVDSSIIRFAYLHKYDFTQQQPMHISIAWPTEVQGKFYNEIEIDIVEYIDQVTELISKWSTVTSLFPNDPIRLENRMKDNVGFYFILLGSKLDHTLSEFIDLQLEYLAQITEYLCLPNKLDYAQTKWVSLNDTN